MESDIESFFKEKGLVTKRSIELHKIDKGYGHPLELGDYDVISIDTKEKTIWNIESKFLGMVGSMKEYYNHQDSFFNRNKKDEKFSRRIEYLETHKNRILELFGIQDSDNYEVKNYMVTNKVFESDLKKIDFDIITFYELKQIVK